jgi:hypothetical protein
VIFIGQVGAVAVERLNPHPSKSEECGTRKIKEVGSGGVEGLATGQIWNSNQPCFKIMCLPHLLEIVLTGFGNS